jgi:hypothetical protein
MGNIVGKQFRVVASKDYATALAESVKEGNQAKFYLAQKDGKALDGVTATTDNDRNTLIINGNRIQGVSNNDISKLDAITDVTKLFKYKGSVDTFDDLPTGALRDVSVGDVWNIKSNFALEGVTYPAYTNVVCVTAAYGSAPMIKWDALGGTMEMGTSVAPTVKDSILRYKTKNNIPISSFGILLGSYTGIMADDDGVIKLQLASKHFTKLNDDTLYIENNGCPLESVYLDVNNSNGLWINDNSLDLRLASATVAGVGSHLEFSAAGPIKHFAINCRGGIWADSNFGAVPALSLKLSSTELNISTADFNRQRVSGLSIDNDGFLFVAIATGEPSAFTGVNYVPAIERIPSEDSGISGGLIIRGDMIKEWLIKDPSFNDYINSLIDAKLKAQ